MDLSVVEDGTTVLPSTDQLSVNAAILAQDLACAAAQSRTPVSATEVLLSNDGKSVSSVNIDGIDHSQTASQLKGEVGISLEPLPDVSSLPDSSDLVWNDSLNQGDSDLNIQIQSACSIDMNVFEQMSSLSGKQTVTGTGSCDEFVSESTIEGKEAVTGSSNCDESICAIGTERKQTVTGTSNCDASVSETMMEVKQTGIGASSTVESVCETMTKGKQSATGISSCDVYFAETTTTEACKVVDSISTTDVIEREAKAEEFACTVNSILTSKTRDLSESKVDCHLTCSTFPECDSTQQLEFSICQPSSNEAGNSREVDEISNHASGSKDEYSLPGRSPPAKKMNILDHSDAENRVYEVQAPLVRLVEGSQCVSSEVQPLASATESHSQDATKDREGHNRVMDVTCAGARNVHENTEAETSCEKTDLSSARDCSANDSTRSDSNSICENTEPKLNDCEEKETRASGGNTRTKINDQELQRDQENCVDESKMDIDENAAESCISVDSSAIESDSSTKDQSSDWNPIIIPTLQSRGSNQPEYRKPLLSSKYQPAAKKGSTDRWGNERQRGWQGAPNQGPVPKRPTLGDIVAEAESGKNRIPTLMDPNEGGNEFYHHQAFNNGEQPRPWNDGPEHRPPFSSPPHWNNPPPPGYMSPFDNGMSQPGPFMSLPPPGPGMPPPGMPPPGIPLPGIPPPGMPPPGMPVPPPGMMIPPSGSMPGPPPVGGMFMPPPPFGGMEPPGGMPWNPGMPPPPNSMPQPFNLPPPSFMPPPNMLPPGCMAPPGSVPPPYGMPPAGIFPPQYDPTQFPPGGMTTAPPYISQYQNYGANPLPGNYSGMPVQPDQEWYDWWQRYSQWTQQCNSTTAAPTWTYETPVATATMLPTTTTPSSTSQPQTDKAKSSSSKTTATSKEKTSRAEKESIASISLPPAKQKLNWIETKPPKPTSHNRLPNLTSLVAHFHSDSKSKSRSSPTKEAEPKDPGSSENMLWIGNLPVGTRAIELRSTISEYGKVSNCKVGALKSQKDAGLFGLVTMETAEDAEYCIRKLNNSIYNGQSIIVKKFQKDN